MKKDELAGKTLPELRDLAKSAGLTGVSKLRKADLIDGLIEAARGKRKGAPAKRAAGRKGSTGKRAIRPAARKAAKSPAARPEASAGKRSAKQRSRPAAAAKKPAARRASRDGVPAKRAAKTRPSKTKGRPSKRSPHAPPESRGLSPRTRRAFTAYRPLGEQRVKASKYYLGVHDTPELDEGFAYPETYGENAITLMVRDPYWLFTYWEFAPDLRADLVKRLSEEVLLASRLVLRVYDVTGVDPDHANEYRDIDVAHGARNWYINVMRVEREYCVDVGLITPDGSFVVIARSNRVTLPPVGPSDVVDEEWVTLESLEEVYRQVERGPTSGSGGWGSGGWGSGGWRQ